MYKVKISINICNKTVSYKKGHGTKHIIGGDIFEKKKHVIVEF